MKQVYLTVKEIPEGMKVLDVWEEAKGYVVLHLESPDGYAASIGLEFSHYDNTEERATSMMVRDPQRVQEELS